MTPAATRIVSPLTLSVLSKNEVIINMFPNGDNWEAAEKVEHSTWHINLGAWADVFIIAPATANSIAKIEAGICDNFLLSTVLAARCPVILSPTMDVDMYRNKITQRNISSLKSKGFIIINPVEGELASGLYGEGKMPEPEELFDFTKNFLLKKKDLKGKKILITAGPTRENIDPVRFISNYSSGKMGYAIAEEANSRGADVILISGPVNIKASDGIHLIKVNTALEMFEAVKSNMKSIDLAVMSAAVSDYRPKIKLKNKLKKEASIINLELEKNPDILEYLGKSKQGYFLIGFALETNNEEEYAGEKLIRKNADMIVLNNPNTEGAGFNTETNVVTLITKEKIERYGIMHKAEVAKIIIEKYLEMKNKKR
jgi:phosphopantothenoylcysteine decarboxylase/phosphopantothenate--cysteine ligase